MESGRHLKGFSFGGVQKGFGSFGGGGELGFGGEEGWKGQHSCWGAGKGCGTLWVGGPEGTERL